MNSIDAVASHAMRTFPRLRILAAAALVAAAAGCAVTPTAGPPRAAQARRLEAAGRYQAAAEAWIRVADAARGPARAAAVVRAAQDYQRADQPAAAWRVIAPLSIAELAPTERAAGAETKARIALAVHRPRAALAALAQAPRPSAPEAQMRLAKLRGEAYFAAGDSARGLETLVARGALASSKKEVLANDELLWDLLSNTDQLPSAAGLSATGQGWVALATIERTAWEVPGEFASRLDAWRQAYPDHPANEGLIAQLQAEEQARLRYPARVAFLLPLTGPYARQGAAVEAGLLAAFYRDQGGRPQIAVYDTQGTGSGARTALGKALTAGADFVIGPLTAPGADGAASAAPGVPVLALNYLQGAAPAHFYQFGLSPTQEARASAERAVSNGLTRAVVLVPDDDWGQGIAAAFTRELTDLGGRVLASATFRPGSEDFATPLGALFGLGASEGREQRLAAVLGQPLGFQERRRQDIQFAFFAARFDTARLVVPQISYYQGLGLPVYSISAVYRPETTPTDLDGVRFPIMPWFVANAGPVADVRNSLRKLFANDWQSDAQLYALGYDAWRLVPFLANSSLPWSRPVRGMTGLLTLGKGGVIQRAPDWARYVNGRVKSTTAAPAP